MTNIEKLENEIETIKARINELEDRLPNKYWYVGYSYSFGVTLTGHDSMTVYASTEERARDMVLASNASAKINQLYELHP